MALTALLPGMPAVTLTEEGRRRAGNGNTPGRRRTWRARPSPAAPARQRVRVLDASGGALLGVAETRADGLLHPLLVLR